MTPEEIFLLRNKLKLTQLELATQLRVNYSVVSRWERGISRPSRLMLRKLEGLAKKAGAEVAHD